MVWWHRTTRLIFPGTSLCYLTPLSYHPLISLPQLLNLAPSASVNGSAYDTNNQYNFHRLCEIWPFWAISFHGRSIVGASHSIAKKRLALKVITGKTTWLPLRVRRRVRVNFNHGQFINHGHSYFHVMITLYSLNNFVNTRLQIFKNLLLLPRMLWLPIYSFPIIQAFEIINFLE